MAFDPSISLGNLIAIGSTIVSVLAAYFKQRSKVESLEEKVLDLRNEVSELRKSDKDQAVLAQRVVALETEAKISSLAVLVQRVNTLDREVNRLQEIESFRTKNEQVGQRR